VPVRGLPYDHVVDELRAEDLAWLGADAHWFDAHTHIGHNDPDGYEADPHELIEALDVAGQQRALVFPMHEPDGYRAANDRVLEAAAESGGRLVALARIDPKAPDALQEAQRCLDAGARGFKLHPRSDDFGLPHPVVEEVVELAGQHRLPVLFHAGRGIPDLGDSVIHMAEAHPGARLILAHAGISDLGLLGPRVAGMPQIMFDTSWWQVSDLLTLFATVPPGQILYASDMPYGGPRYASMAMLRCARAAGLSREQAAAVAGGQLERVLAGEELLDLGGAPGTEGIGPRVLGYERAIGYLTAAVHLTYRGGDPVEALSLARLACQARAEAPHYDGLRLVDAYVGRAQERLEAGHEPYAALHLMMSAQILAGTLASNGHG
jgi:predicted TIM-barrel fold metal-dependent hydrolase